MRGTRLLGLLRSRGVHLVTTGVVAALAGAATVDMTAAFVAPAPPTIAPHPAAATVADPSCGGLVTVICGSESRGESYGGTNSNNGDSRSGSSSASQSVSQGGGKSSPGSKAHEDEREECH
jgi:hypothetical protein